MSVTKFFKSKDSCRWKKLKFKMYIFLSGLIIIWKYEANSKCILLIDQGGHIQANLSSIVLLDHCLFKAAALEISYCNRLSFEDTSNQYSFWKKKPYGFSYWIICIRDKFEVKMIHLSSNYLLRMFKYEFLLVHTEESPCNKMSILFHEHRIPSNW